jgi:hypothetical protein
MTYSYLIDYFDPEGLRRTAEFPSSFAWKELEKFMVKLSKEGADFRFTDKHGCAYVIPCDRVAHVREG